MKKPATPPSTDRVIEEFFKRRQGISGLNKMQELMRDLPYDHWDKLRFRPVPPPYTNKDLWAAVKLNRIVSRKNLPFRDNRDGTFWYVPTGEFQRALHEIDSNARGLIGVPLGTATQEGRDVYLQKSLIEEPFSSSVLEGAATTREIARKMIEEARPPKTIGEKMVLNNYEAMNYVREHREDILTPALILEIHRILTKGTLERPEKVGVLRSKDDDVRVVDNQTEETLHMPPPAGELKKRLEAICDFANSPSDKGDFLHPIIRAVVLHFMLGYDHPFWDGNGRCARALFYWCVLRHGYWLLEYVSISAVIRKAPVQYGMAFLQTESDEGDVTYFINHQLDVLQKSISELQGYLVKKSRELKTLAKTFGALESKLSKRQILLIQNALKHPKAKYTIAEHKKTHGVSYLTAREDLEELSRIGLLHKTKQGVMSVFLVPDKLTERLERRAAA